MKKNLVLLALLTLSGVAHANTYSIDLGLVYDFNNCKAMVAQVSQALEGQPIAVSPDMAADTTNGDAFGRLASGECNAVLKSTGPEQIKLNTSKFHGACTDAEKQNALAEGALYINPQRDFDGNCRIDSVSLK